MHSAMLMPKNTKTLQSNNKLSQDRTVDNIEMKENNKTQVFVRENLKDCTKTSKIRSIYSLDHICNATCIGLYSLGSIKSITDQTVRISTKRTARFVRKQLHKPTTWQYIKIGKTTTLGKP